MWLIPRLCPEFDLSFEYAFLLVDAWILHCHFFDVITTLGYIGSIFLFSVLLLVVFIERKPETKQSRASKCDMLWLS